MCGGERPLPPVERILRLVFLAAGLPFSMSLTGALLATLPKQPSCHREEEEEEEDLISRPTGAFPAKASSCKWQPQRRGLAWAVPVSPASEPRGRAGWSGSRPAGLYRELCRAGEMGTAAPARDLQRALCSLCSFLLKRLGCSHRWGRRGPPLIWGAACLPFPEPA